MRRNRRPGNVFIRLGFFLVIIGFGSAILGTTSSYEFMLLAWANGMQPYAGIVVGLIGVGVLCSPFVLRARQRASSAEPITQQAAFGEGYQHPGFAHEQPQFGEAPHGQGQPGGWQ